MRLVCKPTPDGRIRVTLLDESGFESHGSAAGMQVATFDVTAAEANDMAANLSDAVAEVLRKAGR